jgi:predicted MFS family arabinose efflux permease
MGPIARRTALIALATIYAFGFIDRVLIALVAEQLKAEFGISDFEVGLLGGTAFAVINALATIPIAFLAGRVSRKWITTAALAVASGFTALCAFAGSFGHLLVLRLGMAGGSAGTEAPAHAMISDMYDAAKRPGALSILMLGIPIASLVGSTLGGSLAEHYGWRTTFAVIGLIGLGVAALAALIVREPPRSAQTQPAADALRATGGPLNMFATMLGDRCLRHLLIGTCITGLAVFGVQTFLPAFFARSHGLDLAEAGLAYGILSGVGSFAGTILGGYGAQYLARRDPRWLVAFPGVGAIIGAPIYAIGLMQPDLTVAFPILLVGTVFQFMIMGPAIAAIHNVLEPRHRAMGSAVFLLVLNFIGQGLGPPLAGWVSDLASASAFGPGDFAGLCAGAAGQVAGSACAEAGARGLQYAILCFAGLYVWSGLHLIWAGRFRGRPTA